MKSRVAARAQFLVSLLLAGLLLAAPAFARDAAFLDPNAGGASVGDEAVKVDPKADIDVGDTALNVAKRTSIFFVNQTNLPVKIEKVVVNNDSNVTAESTADDCMKQGTIAPLSRCSVEISTTPTSPGSWSVDVLMTHNGAGRITRAKLTGKTSGAGTTENKSTGLAVNTKDIKPVDFGDVTVGDGKIVRSTLMINDSPDPITLYSIDVIEADNGLQRLDQGCAVDMELAPGASCPVTLLWIPKSSGPISTDLIIRHSGKLGFAVIPIRGSAKGGSLSEGDVKSGAKGADNGKTSLAPPPSATDLEKAMAGKIAPISGAALGVDKGHSDGNFHLIGTIGERAIILKPDGQTATVPVGSEFDTGDATAKLVSVSARSADLLVGGKKKHLELEAAASLIAQASSSNAQKNAPATALSTLTGAPITTKAGGSVSVAPIAEGAAVSGASK